MKKKNSKGDAAQNIINQFSFFELVGPPTRTIKQIWVDDKVNHFNHQRQLMSNWNSLHDFFENNCDGLMNLVYLETKLNVRPVYVNTRVDPLTTSWFLKSDSIRSTKWVTFGRISKKQLISKPKWRSWHQSILYRHSRVKHH